MGVLSGRFFDNGKEKAVNGQTRRQSPGLGTVDAAKWRHAAATGRINSLQVWGGAMWVKGRLWKMGVHQICHTTKRTHRLGIIYLTYQ